MNPDKRHLIVRVGRPNFGVRYGVGPLGAITIPRDARPSELPEELAREIEDLCGLKLGARDPRVHSLCERICEACPSFATVLISYPGGMVWYMCPDSSPMAI